VLLAVLLHQPGSHLACVFVPFSPRRIHDEAFVIRIASRTNVQRHFSLLAAFLPLVLLERERPWRAGLWLPDSSTRGYSVVYIGRAQSHRTIFVNRSIGRRRARQTSSTYYSVLRTSYIATDGGSVRCCSKATTTAIVVVVVADVSAVPAVVDVGGDGDGRRRVRPRLLLLPRISSESSPY